VHLFNEYKKVRAKLWESGAPNINSYMIGCTIGTHIGPNAFGISFFEK